MGEPQLVLKKSPSFITLERPKSAAAEGRWCGAVEGGVRWGVDGDGGWRAACGAGGRSTRRGAGGEHVVIEVEAADEVEVVQVVQVEERKDGGGGGGGAGGEGGCRGGGGGRRRAAEGGGGREPKQGR